MGGERARQLLHERFGPPPIVHPAESHPQVVIGLLHDRPFADGHRIQQVMGGGGMHRDFSAGA